MIRRLTYVSALLLAWVQPVTAQTCGGTYVIAPGDSLSLIARTQFQNAFLWTEIYALNRDQIGPDPDTILHGTAIVLPCLNATSTDENLDAYKQVEIVQSPPPVNSLTPPKTVEEDAAVATLPALTLITGDNLSPFSDADLPQGGMLADVMIRALATSDPQRDTVLLRKNWSDVIPEKRDSSVSFPVLHPDCAAQPELPLCSTALFSEMMFELLVVVFVNVDAPLPMTSPQDMHGHTLCRPAGLSTHMLDAQGRHWLTEKRIALEQPTTAQECFDALRDGAVAGVVLNEFTGRATIQQMGLQGQVEGLVRTPLEIGSYHAVVHRDAPGAAQTIEAIDQGLLELRKSGEHREIMEKHLRQLWAGL